MRKDKRSILVVPRVAVFLAWRYITRTSPWQTGLVIFVMMLTFLNLVVVNGLLVGLIDGAYLGYTNKYAGDLLVSKLPEKQFIERASSVRAAIERDEAIAAFSPRIIEGGEVEANYLAHISQQNALPDSVGVSIAGINLQLEEQVTGLSESMIEGEFLAPGDDDQVVLGANLIDRHFPSEIGLQTLSDVYPGDKVRVTVGGATREFFVKGIVKTKTDATDLRVFMLEGTLTRLTGSYGSLVTDEFAIRVKSGAGIEDVRARLLGYGFGSVALVRTAQEAIGEFLDEIKDTFALLGNIIGAISVAVASITIFIIIFITAITRQKYIGILKAIGISGVTIEFSYVFLSLFYAIAGIGVGLAILYGLLLPYFTNNPIDFPFSDGILSVTTFGVIARSAILMLTTIVAGYIPARLIVKKNTLDAILGR